MISFDGCFAFFGTQGVRQFKPRSISECVTACGLHAADSSLRVALDMGCGVVGNADETHHLFRLIGTPQKDDWLSVRHESSQTFEVFQRYPARPSPTQSTAIHLFTTNGSTTANLHQFLEHMVEYVCAFFPGMAVRMSENAISLDDVRTRCNEFGHTQYFVEDILDKIRSPREESDYCRLVITLEDLFDETGRCTDDSGNVGGQSYLDDGIGIFSFARSSPYFYNGTKATDAVIEMGERQTMSWLRKCRHMLVHELCHMFGMRHCVFFHCLMNGANGPNDTNAGMMFLCPVCLHKLTYSLRAFCGSPSMHSITDRYIKLQSVLQSLTEKFVMRDFEGSSLQYDLAWLCGRLSHLRALESYLEYPPRLQFKPIQLEAPVATDDGPWTQQVDPKDINVLMRADIDAAKRRQRDQTT